MCQKKNMSPRLCAASRERLHRRNRRASRLHRRKVCLQRYRYCVNRIGARATGSGIARAGEISWGCVTLLEPGDCRNIQQLKTIHEMGYPTIFHQPWWLEAAAGDRLVDVRSALDSGQWASIKVFRTTKWGVPMLDMPPLSHTLSPEVQGLEGKPETVRRMRLFLLDEAIRKLPPHYIFNLVLAAGETDALAFRLNDFAVNVEYTYRLEDCTDQRAILANMRDTTRRVIRRAEEQLTVGKNDVSIDEFISFYFNNLVRRVRSPNHSRSVYGRVLSAAFEHGAAETFTARGKDGRIRAAICAVFDRHTMYYLLTTQDRAIKDNGSVAVLIWSGMKSAGEKGLAFDFDGFGDRGAAQFLGQFGGTLVPRLRVNRMPKILQGLMHLGPRFRPSPRD
jgi:hypothetical protein